MASSAKQTKYTENVAVPSSIQQMDQNTAQWLFEEGAILAFFDVPPGTEFGIDYNSWNVGSQFKGVKMIPPGVHFVFYSAVNQSNQTAPRTGFFHDFKRKEILIKRWDKLLEDISTEPINAVDIETIIANKQELDRFLGPYPYESYRKWVSLTNFLTPQVMEHLQPTSIKISSVAELLSEGSTTQSRKEAAEKEENDKPQTTTETKDTATGLPDMKRVEGTQIKFTSIPKKKYPDGASPAEISKYSMDHSYVLNNLLNSVYKDNQYNLLGEIQFAFICFLLGQVYDAFEQWKHLVHLMCSCEESLTLYPDLYKQFISILHYHIKEIPEDFFVDIVTRDNFLVSTLRCFFSNIENSNADEGLKIKGKKFQENLEKRFKWDFAADDEDELPVVVEVL